MLNMNIATSLHGEALKYPARGIPVFPFQPKGTMAMVKWNMDATTDTDQVNKWWTQNPIYNIGILTGEKSGIVVIVFSTPEAWAIGQEKGLPVTPIVKIGNEHHVYCRYQGDANYSLKSAGVQGIDIRTDGSNIMVPPSLLVQNPHTAMEKVDRYSWVDGKDLDDLELGEIPQWLLAGAEEEDDVVPSLVSATVDELTEISNAQSAIMGIKETNFSAEMVDLPLTFGTKIELPLTSGKVLDLTDSNHANEREPMPPDNEGWKAPILFEGVGVPEIKSELLPGWLGEYAGAVSRSTQTPEGMAVMLGLSAIATCVQKKFEVCPYGDGDYMETLSLWTVTVLQSSERKTPILKAMTAPIYAWEKEQAKLLKATIDETSTRIQIAQKRIEKLRKSAAEAADADARDKLAQEISELQASMPAEVRAPRVWVGDTTAESLQDLLAENDEKMAVLTDEGGIFEIMAGLYNNGTVNIDIYLQAYAGMPVRVKRKMREVDLERPALTFGLTVQPVVIEGFANGSKRQFRGKGALGRFLFCAYSDDCDRVN